jgi:hypothetical protein
MGGGYDELIGGEGWALEVLDMVRHRTVGRPEVTGWKGDTHKETYWRIFLLTKNRNPIIISSFQGMKRRVVLELVAGFTGWRVNPADTSWNQIQGKDCSSRYLTQERVFFPMAKRRGNPNWGKPEPIGPVTPTITEFEQVVREYKLSPDQYLRSTRLREWARRNKNSKYIPEPLLEAWGFEIESTL